METLRIPSHGLLLGATLYKAKGSGDHPRPVLIMGNGVGLLASCGIPKYAEYFTEHLDIACLAFDYRTFGISEGEPREYVQPFHHVQDYHSVIAHVRSGQVAGVDPSRISLWGFSFAGGHVAAVASKDRKIEAVIAHLPYVNTLYFLWHIGPTNTVISGTHAVSDLILGVLLKRQPRRFPIVADKKFALLPGPKPYKAMVDLGDGDTSFKEYAYQANVPARLVFPALFYWPWLGASQIKSRLLVVVGGSDNILGSKGQKRAITKVRDAQYKIIEHCDHFDPYLDRFDEVVKLECDFLRNSLSLKMANL